MAMACADVCDIKIQEVDLAEESLLLKFESLRLNEGWGKGGKDIEYYLSSGLCRGFALFFKGDPIVWLLLIDLKSCYFLGSFIAMPEFRGYGYGGLLLRHLITVVGVKPLVLYSVPRTLSFYEKSGFHLVDQVLKRVVFELPTPAIVRASSLDIDMLTAYEVSKLVDFDQSILGGADRSNLLKALLEDRDYVITSLSMDGSDVRGYGVLRCSPDEVSRFSVYAIDHTAANAIMSSIITQYLSRALKVKSVIADIPISYFASVFGVIKAAGVKNPALQKEELTTMVLDIPKTGRATPFFTLPSMPTGVDHCAVLFMEAG